MAVVTRNLQRWTRWHAVAALIFASLGAVIVSGALADIYERAIKDEENSHILLVPLVALWMVWVRVGRIRYCRPSWTFIGPIIVAIGWLSWSYGYWHNRDTFFHLGAILVVLGCVMAVLGRHVLMRFMPAVALLIFLVPISTHVRQKIAVPMQNRTTRAVEVAMKIGGMDVRRDGNSLTYNNQSITIIDQCNGMRMVFPLILVGYAFSFGLPLNNWVRAMIMIISPFVAIFCNVLRIMLTILVVAFGPKGMFEPFHDAAGWAMLPVSFLLLLGIIRMLRWAMIPVMRYTLVSQ